MKLIFILLLFLIGCKSPEKEFYKRKHPHETKHSYNDKKGLMLLNNTQLGRNKYLSSKTYHKNLHKTQKRLRKTVN